MKGRDKGFIQGYCCAVASIMRTHGDDVIACDVLAEGVSLEDVKLADVDEYDMEVLDPLFTEIERKRNLSRKRRN